jgi:hypothetical protein
MNDISNLNWCCPQFQAYWELRGQRGAAIAVTDDARFKIEHRALDPGVAIGSAEHSVSLVTTFDILYCPWCGRRLRDWYHDVVSALSA